MLRRAGTPFGVFSDPETMRGALNNFIARVSHRFFPVGFILPTASLLIYIYPYSKRKTIWGYSALPAAFRLVSVGLRFRVQRGKSGEPIVMPRGSRSVSNYLVRLRWRTVRTLPGSGCFACGLIQVSIDLSASACGTSTRTSLKRR